MYYGLRTVCMLAEFIRDRLIAVRVLTMFFQPLSQSKALTGDISSLLVDTMNMVGCTLVGANDELIV